MGVGRVRGAGVGVAAGAASPEATSAGSVALLRVAFAPRREGRVVRGREALPPPRTFKVGIAAPVLATSAGVGRGVAAGRAGVGVTRATVGVGVGRTAAGAVVGRAAGAAGRLAISVRAVRSSLS